MEGRPWIQPCETREESWSVGSKRFRPCGSGMSLTTSHTTTLPSPPPLTSRPLVRPSPPSAFFMFAPRCCCCQASEKHALGSCALTCATSCHFLVVLFDPPTVVVAVDRAHNLIPPLSPPEARYWPHGEKASDQIVSLSSNGGTENSSSSSAPLSLVDEDDAPGSSPVTRNLGSSF